MQNPVLLPKSYSGNTPWALHGSRTVEDPFDRAGRPSAFDTSKRGISVLLPVSLLRRESAEMLPMTVTVNLAKKRVIVKRLLSIQKIGAMAPLIASAPTRPGPALVFFLNQPKISC